VGAEEPHRTTPITCVIALAAPRLLVDALVAAINAEDGLECAGVAPTLAQATALVTECEPDVLLLQATLPGSLSECMEQARSLCPEISILLLSGERDDELMRRAAAAGASGCLLMDSPLDEVVRAIRAASGGGIFIDRAILSALLEERQGDVRSTARGPNLTPRERNVLVLMGEGLDPLAISKSLGITLNTCRGHVQSVIEKLGTHTQLEAVVAAAHLGLLPGLAPDR